jgi:hypothetical protein
VRPSGRKVIGTTQVAVGCERAERRVRALLVYEHPDARRAAVPGGTRRAAVRGLGRASRGVGSPTGRNQSGGGDAQRRESVISHLPKLPRVPLPAISEPGVSSTRGIIAILLVVLALGTMGVLVVNYIRGAWNP